MYSSRNHARDEHARTDDKTPPPELVSGVPQQPGAPTDSGPPLVFVFDTASGAWNAFVDSIYRACASSGEFCALLRWTASPAAARRHWQAFIAGLGRAGEFLYSDELASRHGVSGEPLPAVFERTASGVQLLISADQLRACRSLDEVEGLVRRSIRNVP